MNRDLEDILNAVAEATDVSPCQMLGKGKFREIVDAKKIVVFLLRERGYYTHSIAEWLSMTPRNVNAILTSMHRRLSQDDIIGKNLERARKYLH